VANTYCADHRKGTKMKKISGYHGWMYKSGTLGHHMAVELYTIIPIASACRAVEMSKTLIEIS